MICLRHRPVRSCSGINLHDSFQFLLCMFKHKSSTLKSSHVQAVVFLLTPMSTKNHNSKIRKEAQITKYLFIIQIPLTLKSLSSVEAILSQESSAEETNLAGYVF